MSIGGCKIVFRLCQQYQKKTIKRVEGKNIFMYQMLVNIAWAKNFTRRAALMMSY